MDITLTREATASTSPAAAGHTPRFDLYVIIHKALRACMADTLLRVGRADPADEAQVARELQQVDQLLDVCLMHVKHENRHIHPALERARPGMTQRIAGEHEEHLEHIEDLRDLTAFVRRSAPAARGAALMRLYHALALFVAHNFEHMHYEETEHNAALWSTYSDEELVAIEHAIVSQLPPDTMQTVLRWMIPAMNAQERALMVGGMQASMRAAGAPPEAFAGTLAQIHDLLDTPEWIKLCAALDIAAA